MPLFECQTCEYFTPHAQKAKIHNEKDKHHFFKQVQAYDMPFSYHLALKRKFRS